MYERWALFISDDFMDGYYLLMMILFISDFKILGSGLEKG